MPEKGAEGVIIAQGANIGGWSLYTKGGKLKYRYNWGGFKHFMVEANTPIPVGDHQVRMEFAYAGPGLGKGGTVTLYTDGKKVEEGTVDATLTNVFSADDGCDVGEDTGAPVSPDYGPHGNGFNGRVKGVYSPRSPRPPRPSIIWLIPKRPSASLGTTVSAFLKDERPIAPAADAARDRAPHRASHPPARSLDVARTRSRRGELRDVACSRSVLRRRFRRAVRCSLFALAQPTTSLTRRLRSCACFLPISARRSIARLASSTSRARQTGGFAGAGRRHERAAERLIRGSVRCRGLRFPRITAAAKLYGCRANPGSPRNGRFRRRVSGFDLHSWDRVGVQTRRSGANGCRSHAERPRGPTIGS